MTHCGAQHATRPSKHPPPAGSASSRPDPAAYPGHRRHCHPSSTSPPPEARTPVAQPQAAPLASRRLQTPTPQLRARPPQETPCAACPASSCSPPSPWPSPPPPWPTRPPPTEHRRARAADRPARGPALPAPRAPLPSPAHSRSATASSTRPVCDTRSGTTSTRRRHDVQAVRQRRPSGQAARPVRVDRIGLRRPAVGQAHAGLLPPRRGRQLGPGPLHPDRRADLVGGRHRPHP